MRTSLLATAIFAILSANLATSAHATAGRRPDSEIDRLIEAAAAAAGHGDSTAAISLLQEALPLAEVSTPAQHYTVLHNLAKQLQINHDRSAIDITKKLIIGSERYFGPHDYRTIYGQVNRAINSGIIDNDFTDTKLLLPKLVPALQNAAHDSNQVAESALVGLEVSELLYANGQDVAGQQMTVNSIEFLHRNIEKYSEDLGASYAAIAVHYSSSGHDEEAYSAGKKAISIFNALKIDGSLRLSGTYSLAADIAYDSHPQEAEGMAKMALNVADHLVPQDAETSLIATYVLAKIYRQEGHVDLAEPLFERAELLSDRAPITSSSSENILAGIARYYLSTDQDVKASATLKHAIRIAGSKTESPGLARLYYTIGNVELNSGNLPEALQMAIRSRNIYYHVLASDSIQNASPQALLARISERQGDFENSADYWSKCLAYLKKQSYPQPSRELAAISSVNAQILAHRTADWQVAREAADSLTGRLVNNANLALSDAEYSLVDTRLINQMLDIGWASSHAQKH